MSAAAAPGSHASCRAWIIASASANGKTTLGRALAERPGVPLVELDALAHGPGWAQISAEELRARIEPVVASAGWVIDGTYLSKLGSTILDAADLIVWLDLPIRVWLPRLVRRTWRRVREREELWNGNRETLRTAIGGWDSLLVFALRSHFQRRRRWPAALAGRPVVRLRSTGEVRRFLEGVRPSGCAAQQRPAADGEQPAGQLPRPVCCIPSHTNRSARR